MKGISDANLKVIYSLIAIIVLVLAYMFGVSKNIQKHSELKEQNEILQAEVNELSQKKASIGEVEDEIASIDARMDELCKRFPYRMTEQTVYAIMQDMMDKTGVECSSISISPNNLFFSTGLVPEGELSNNVKDDYLAWGLEEPEEEESTEEPVLDLANLAAYETAVAIPFSGEYDQVKDMITYINEHENHMSMGPLSASFDSSTGLVSGSVTISMYSLLGNGETYSEPSIPSYEKGVDNIFGSYKKR